MNRASRSICKTLYSVSHTAICDEHHATTNQILIAMLEHFLSDQLIRLLHVQYDKYSLFVFTKASSAGQAQNTRLCFVPYSAKTI